LPDDAERAVGELVVVRRLQARHAADRGPARAAGSSGRGIERWHGHE
jgi:hypothetical protein